MATLILLLLVLIIVWLVIRITKTVINVSGHWQHYFDDCTYSSKVFYQAIESIVHKREIPGVRVSRITYPEGGMFSANRAYLRVERGKIVFDICAAPFAKGFFISSWQGDLPRLREKILSAIPFIGPSLAAMFFKKTYYQADTEQMFASAVHSSVLEAIKNITTDTGARDLTELERQFGQVGK